MRRPARTHAWRPRHEMRPHHLVQYQDFTADQHFEACCFPGGSRQKLQIRTGHRRKTVRPLGPGTELDGARTQPVLAARPVPGNQSLALQRTEQAKRGALGQPPRTGKLGEAPLGVGIGECIEDRKGAGDRLRSSNTWCVPVCGTACHNVGQCCARTGAASRGRISVEEQANDANGGNVCRGETPVRRARHSFVARSRHQRPIASQPMPSIAPRIPATQTSQRLASRIGSSSGASPVAARCGPHQPAGRIRR